MNDEALIVRYYAGDDAAFAELYGRYFPQLVTFLRRSVSAEQAEDLAEEAFLRVVRTKATGSSRFDPQRNTSFRTWLFTITHNVLRDHLPREGRQPRAPLDVEEIEATVPQESWEEPTTVQVQAAELFAGPLGECLAELTESLREVLLLDLVGQTLTEISESLEISYNAAGGRLSRARAQMRACLRQRGFRFLPRNSELPPGTEVVMTFPDEVWVRLDPTQFGPAG